MKINKIITITTVLIISSFSVPLKVVKAETVNHNQIAILSEDNWELIASESGLFTIQMPGNPQQETKNTEILGQPRDWELWQLNADNSTYVLAYIDLSEQDIREASQDTFISLRNSILEPLGLEGLNLDGRSINLNGYPGHEFLGIKSGKLVAIRIYLVGTRLYGLLVSADNTNTIVHYLNSFQVEPRWNAFTSKTGNFDIQLPETPTEEIEKVEVGGDELVWNLLVSRDFTLQKNQQEDIENLYSVGYADIPKNLSQEDSQQLLQTIGISILDRFNLQPLKDSGREINHHNHSGLEFIGIENGRIFAVRIYQVDNRLYGLFTSSNELTKIEKFLQSFQLL